MKETLWRAWGAWQRLCARWCWWRSNAGAVFLLLAMKNATSVQVYRRGPWPFFHHHRKPVLKVSKETVEKNRPLVSAAVMCYVLQGCEVRVSRNRATAAVAPAHVHRLPGFSEVGREGHVRVWINRINLGKEERQ